MLEILLRNYLRVVFRKVTRDVSGKYELAERILRIERSGKFGVNLREAQKARFHLERNCRREIVKS